MSLLTKGQSQINKTGKCCSGPHIFKKCAVKDGKKKLFINRAFMNLIVYIHC